MEAFKRFMVFGYDHYYPGGGISDCITSYNTLEEVKKKDFIGKYPNNYTYDNYEVFDRIEGIMIEI